MSETFRCEDKETLVAYLYGEIDLNGRREVERHLRTCSACVRESDALRGVRETLAAWAPPEADLGFAITQKPASVLRSTRWATLRTLPAWMQVAAAILVMAAGAALANVQVQYNSDGFVLRTGWMAPAPTGAPAVARTEASDESWRPALAALEQTLRRDLTQVRESTVAAPAARVDNTVDTAALMRKVEALVAASESRQREEYGLRLATAQRDFNTQRAADLVRIQERMGMLQRGTISTEANQREMMNILRRVAQPIP